MWRSKMAVVARVAHHSRRSSTNARNHHHHHHHHHHQLLLPPTTVKMTRTMTTTTASSSSSKRNNNSDSAAAAATTTTTTAAAWMKPWKDPVVTSNGDYRAEAFLEDPDLPLYKYQRNLPRLPVPSVAETLKKFWPTALPMARNEKEVANLRESVNKFPQQAAALQQRLLERKQDFDAGMSSWLQLWWNTAGYLQVRDPVVVNVTYFFQFADDPSAGTNIRRGAALLNGVAEYRKLVCSGKLKAGTVGRGDRRKHLCSAAHKYMFHATRIPKRDQDEIRLHDPSRNNHLIVAVGGRFFSMDFCDPTTGNPYPVPVLEDGLQQCIDLSNQLGPEKQQLGYLTSSNRDDWADARDALIAVGGPDMERALDKLQSGAILLCLDEESPVSHQEAANLLWHGGNGKGDRDGKQPFSSSSSSSSSSANRWYDKSIQLSVTPNGKAGLIGEHSMMDGMPVVGLVDHITNNETTYGQCAAAAAAAAAASSESSSSGLQCTVEPIFASVLEQISSNSSSSSTVDSLVDKARDDLMNLQGRHSLDPLFFHGYGSNFIKKAGYSPDAFVQQAIQLAATRLWGEPAGTYEASQVRTFLHGRTETTRSVSVQSAAFCREMGLRPKMDEHDETARKNKLRLLQDAVTAHVKYLAAAGQATGVDRHFLGLSMLVEPGEVAPDLYDDPVFQRSKRWRVSTSHLTHPRITNWGYGEVVPDGVGLAYSIHPRHCVFNCTALAEHEWTDKLCKLLEESLLEMRTLVEMDNFDNKSASKL